MRTVYLGHNTGYASACYEESELLAVFWHGGEGNIAKRAANMLDFCKRKGVISVNHSRLNDVIQHMIFSIEPDLIVVGEYHFLLRKKLINFPRYGVINLHGAPLPKYRGAHPINWMIINGETQGAVSCHYVTEGLDSGDIIGQAFFPILDTETAYDVRPKIEATGRQLLVDMLRRFRAEGKLVGVPQDESQASYQEPRKPEDGLIDWNLPPKRVYDFVRALTKPYPGAFAMLDGRKVHLWRVELPGENSGPKNDAAVGTVLNKWQGGFSVSVAGGTVNVLDWEAGGRAINVNDRLIGRDSR
jgi:methionyl-tRNA formyltransferase